MDVVNIRGLNNDTRVICISLIVFLQTAREHQHNVRGFKKTDSLFNDVISLALQTNHKRA